MSISVMFIRCKRCGVAGRIEVKEIRRTCFQEARRQGWTRRTPGAWECPDCSDRLTEAQFERLELEDENAHD